MRNRLTPDKIRRMSLFMLLPVSLTGFSVVSVSSMKFVTAYGPIQSGHENITCVQCHARPVASWRQQIQANFRHFIGTRIEPVDFGFHPVTSSTCLSCHERPNERHPIYRFREPRFQKLEITVDATSCLGCHSEHTNERAHVELGFCSSCHGALTLEFDPIDISHEILINDQRWDTCLGCHDFHGNHAYEVPTQVEQAFSASDLRNYLQSGKSPYGTSKTFEAINQ